MYDELLASDWENLIRLDMRTEDWKFQRRRIVLAKIAAAVVQSALKEMGTAYSQCIFGSEADS